MVIINAHNYDLIECVNVIVRANQYNKFCINSIFWRGREKKLMMFCTNRVLERKRTEKNLQKIMSYADMGVFIVYAHLLLVQVNSRQLLMYHQDLTDRPKWWFANQHIQRRHIWSTLSFEAILIFIHKFMPIWILCLFGSSKKQMETSNGENMCIRAI